MIGGIDFGLVSATVDEDLQDRRIFLPSGVYDRYSYPDIETVNEEDLPIEMLNIIKRSANEKIAKCLYLYAKSYFEIQGYNSGLPALDDDLNTAEIALNKKYNLQTFNQTMSETLKTVKASFPKTYSKLDMLLIKIAKQMTDENKQETAPEIAPLTFALGWGKKPAAPVKPVQEEEEDEVPEDAEVEEEEEEEEYEYEYEYENDEEEQERLRLEEEERLKAEKEREEAEAKAKEEERRKKEEEKRIEEEKKRKMEEERLRAEEEERQRIEKERKEEEERKRLEKKAKLLTRYTQISFRVSEIVSIIGLSLAVLAFLIGIVSISFIVTTPKGVELLNVEAPDIELSDSTGKSVINLANARLTAGKDGENVNDESAYVTTLDTTLSVICKNNKILETTPADCVLSGKKITENKWIKYPRAVSLDYGLNVIEYKFDCSPINNNSLVVSKTKTITINRIIDGKINKTDENTYLTEGKKSFTFCPPYAKELKIFNGDGSLTRDSGLLQECHESKTPVDYGNNYICEDKKKIIKCYECNFDGLAEKYRIIYKKQRENLDCSTQINDNDKSSKFVTIDITLHNEKFVITGIRETNSNGENLETKADFQQSPSLKHIDEQILGVVTEKTSTKLSDTIKNRYIDPRKVANLNIDKEEGIWTTFIIDTPTLGTYPRKTVTNTTTKGTGHNLILEISQTIGSKDYTEYIQTCYDHLNKVKYHRLKILGKWATWSNRSLLDLDNINEVGSQKMVSASESILCDRAVDDGSYLAANSHVIEIHQYYDGGDQRIQFWTDLETKDKYQRLYVNGKWGYWKK